MSKKQSKPSDRPDESVNRALFEFDQQLGKGAGDDTNPVAKLDQSTVPGGIPAGDTDADIQQNLETLRLLDAVRMLSLIHI